MKSLIDHDPPEELDAFCPVCRKIVLARVAGGIVGALTMDMFEGIDGEEPAVSCPEYKLAFCIRCNSPFLFRTYRISWEGVDYTQTQQDLLYPRLAAEKAVPTGVPASVERPYRSAITCLEAGEFDASAIMARKSLEALCRELGAEKGSLQKRLQTLSVQRVIDARLLEWADELRIIGNDAAHDLDAIISHDDARDILDFVEAILVYTFTLDQKFKAFQRRRKAPASQPDGAST
jgi:hypothetical protein